MSSAANALQDAGRIANAASFAAGDPARSVQPSDKVAAVTAPSSRVLVYLVALSLAVPPLAQAQTAPPAASQTAQPASQPVFRAEEIDQMVAGIALYPDQLLAQIFMASNYPLEVVQAERWVSNSANAKLKGAQLETALQTQSWDPSVKSLVPFPAVLKMMSDKLDGRSGSATPSSRRKAT